MNVSRFNRREFLHRSLAATSTLVLGTSTILAAPGEAAAKRTAADQVVLGKTGIKTSRLGMGTGSNSGQVQHDLGREGFNSLVKYAYDQGITSFDSSESYQTFEWLGGAVKGLPREKLFIQSKIPGQPQNVLEVIDHHRKVFDTDYIDSMLVHCMIKGGWTDPWKCGGSLPGPGRERYLLSYDQALRRRNAVTIPPHKNISGSRCVWSL